MGLDIGFLVALREFPQWFYWATAGIQTLGIIVSFIISYLGYKAYKLRNEKKYKYFFYGFLFLGFSFLGNLALNILLRLGYARFFVEKRYELFIAPLFLVYYFFLIGVLLAYVSFAIVYAEIKKSNKIWLFYFWTFVIGIYTFRDQILFNMFSAIVLSFVMLYAYEKHKASRRDKSVYMIFLAFSSLFLFHILILVQSQIAIFLVIRFVFLLLGLVLLLITLLKIYGRKKK